MPEDRDGRGNTTEELARLRVENARLLKAEQEWRLEREILRRAAACFARGGEVSPCRWDFISDNRADFGVQRICRMLGASRAGCYRHLATEQARTERQAEEKRTVNEIRAIHAEHQGAYGAARVHAELRARGRRINRWGYPRLRGSVTRLMRINHIVGRHLRKKRRTTIADRTAPPPPDLVTRDFTADTLNTRWCGDITYVAVGTTWLYLAAVIDICSRKVVGWSIADHMRTSLVTDAIEMAVAARGGRVHGVHARVLEEDCQALTPRLHRIMSTRPG